jgi:hypothetical protein
MEPTAAERVLDRKFEGVVTHSLLSVFGSSDGPISVDVELGVAPTTML